MDFLNDLPGFYIQNKAVVNSLAAVTIFAAAAFFFMRAKKRAGSLKAGSPARPPAPAESLEELKVLVEKYMIAEEFEKAAEVLKKLIERDKAGNLRDYYCQLVKVYYRLSMHEDAVEVFRIAIGLKTSFIEGVLPIVSEYFEESLKRGGKKITMLYGDCVVSAHIKQKNTAAAIAAIDKLIAANPGMTAILKRKAFLVLETGDDVEALEIFTELYRTCSDDERIRYEYCRLLIKRGRAPEAVPAILESLKNEAEREKNLALFSESVSFMINKKMFEPAIDMSAAAYKICGSNSCLRALAEVYLKKGDLDRANDIYLKALKKDPSDAAAAKRQKYVQALVEERDAAGSKKGAGTQIVLTIDGEPVSTGGRIECDSSTTVQVPDSSKLFLDEAAMYFEKADYKKAITAFQNARNASAAVRNSAPIVLRLLECFCKENMNQAAEKVYDSFDMKAAAARGGDLTDFQYGAAKIFLENGALEKAEALLCDIAASDMSYKDTARLLSTVKNKNAARKTSAQNEAPGQRPQLTEEQDDSARTVIASAAASETDYINNRYRVAQLIGKGGMGAVYLAADNTEKKAVAIKIPLLKYKGDANFLKRFQREADILKKLDHPNILKVFDVTAGELPYMVMELLTGSSLRQKLRDKKNLTYAETRDIAIQCCDGLEYTHARNIIHRDIKPENIMLVNEGKTVKLMDFGLSKALDESAITKSGAIIGTFAYISPEQCLGEQLDGRADIYSLGVMFYEMLTGERPFTSGDLVEQHIKARPVSLTKKKPGIPYPVEIAVMKCLEKKPQDRYQTAADLKAAWLKIS